MFACSSQDFREYVLQEMEHADVAFTFKVDFGGVVLDIRDAFLNGPKPKEYDGLRYLASGCFAKHRPFAASVEIILEKFPLKRVFAWYLMHPEFSTNIDMIHWRSQLYTTSVALLLAAVFISFMGVLVVQVVQFAEDPATGWWAKIVSLFLVSLALLEVIFGAILGNVADGDINNFGSVFTQETYDRNDIAWVYGSISVVTGILLTLVTYGMWAGRSLTADPRRPSPEVTQRNEEECYMSGPTSTSVETSM